MSNVGSHLREPESGHPEGSFSQSFARHVSAAASVTKLFSVDSGLCGPDWTEQTGSC